MEIPPHIAGGMGGTNKPITLDLPQGVPVDIILRPHESEEAGRHVALRHLSRPIASHAPRIAETASQFPMVGPSGVAVAGGSPLLRLPSLSGVCSEVLSSKSIVLLAGHQIISLTKIVQSFRFKLLNSLFHSLSLEHPTYNCEMFIQVCELASESLDLGFLAFSLSVHFFLKGHRPTL